MIVYIFTASETIKHTKRRHIVQNYYATVLKLHKLGFLTSHASESF
jgi:hypothetical protein